jgi:NADH dehydrogenase
VALVLGGRGYIGRHLVNVLTAQGMAALIGTRQARDHQVERELPLHRLVQPSEWQQALEGVDVVINCVGILRERPNETFEQVHHHAVEALATACKRRDVPLVHVSALGIDGPIGCEFTRSKLRGEEAIAASGCRSVIVRASIVDGDDGYGSGWFRRVANWPLWVLPAGATQQLSPVAVTDLGEAIACVAQTLLADQGYDANTPPTELLEVGCGQQFTLKDYLLRLRETGSAKRARPWAIVRVPDRVARLFAHLFDRFNLTPYSIGHHELLRYDNLPRVNALPGLLNHAPLLPGDRPVDQKSRCGGYAVEHAMPTRLAGTA